MIESTLDWMVDNAMPIAVAYAIIGFAALVLDCWLAVYRRTR